MDCSALTELVTQSYKELSLPDFQMLKNRKIDCVLRQNDPIMQTLLFFELAGDIWIWNYNCFPFLITLIQVLGLRKGIRIDLVDRDITIVEIISLLGALSIHDIPAGITINLSNNDIGDEGLIAFLNGIKSFGRVKDLDLRFNYNLITDKGIESIVELISQQGLKEGMLFHFDHNEISDLGAKKLLELLQAIDIPKGVAFSLQHNNLSAAMKQEIQEAVVQNRGATQSIGIYL